jgi:hypothetical protein
MHDVLLVSKHLLQFSHRSHDDCVDGLSSSIVIMCGGKLNFDGNVFLESDFSLAAVCGRLFIIEFAFVGRTYTDCGLNDVVLDLKL